jgi:hypothetical protein
MRGRGWGAGAGSGCCRPLVRSAGNERGQLRDSTAAVNRVILRITPTPHSQHHYGSYRLGQSARCAQRVELERTAEEVWI